MPLHRLVGILTTKRLVVTLLLGYSSGVPLLAIASTLQAWLFDEGVSTKTLGLLSLIGLPYTLKFLWAPLFDGITPLCLGQRRGWLLLTQLGCMSTLFGLSMLNPINNPVLFSLTALLTSLFSASQDIIVDALRRDTLKDEELGLGAALYISGYRLGMLTSGALALLLADSLLSWSSVFQFIACAMLPGVFASLISEEPPPQHNLPRGIVLLYKQPLLEIIARPGIWISVNFILLYKLGDTLAATMTTPFILELGFSKTDLALIVKSYGLVATLAGSFLGGTLLLRYTLARSLLISGLLQMVSTGGFLLLTLLEPGKLMLAIVISIENFASGMGTSAFVAYLSRVTKRQYSATQYALLSSIMGIPRVLLASSTGFLVEATGWFVFFLCCTLIALPGLLLLSSACRSSVLAD
jgi:PAT family beta-lactamase induction signal transducer AmpG